ncbi:MAG: transglycosylase SLT domain-containing protein [Elusimicrobiales bacterium]
MRFFAMLLSALIAIVCPATRAALAGDSPENDGVSISTDTASAGADMFAVSGDTASAGTEADRSTVAALNPEAGEAASSDGVSGGAGAASPPEAGNDVEVSSGSVSGGAGAPPVAANRKESLISQGGGISSAGWGGQSVEMRGASGGGSFSRLSGISGASGGSAAYKRLNTVYDGSVSFSGASASVRPARRSGAAVSRPSVRRSSRGRASSGGRAASGQSSLSGASRGSDGVYGCAPNSSGGNNGYRCKGPDFFKGAGNNHKYDAYFDEAAETRGNGMDPRLLKAVAAVESGFSAKVCSGVGACGLMQIMPATAAMAAKNGKYHDNPKKLSDPQTNIRLGATILNDLFDQMRKKYSSLRGVPNDKMPDWATQKVLWGYNAGPRALDWGKPKTGVTNYSADILTGRNIVTVE